jgi:hypothetical protein
MDYGRGADEQLDTRRLLLIDVLQPVTWQIPKGIAASDWWEGYFGFWPACRRALGLEASLRPSLLGMQEGFGWTAGSMESR